MVGQPFYLNPFPRRTLREESLPGGRSRGEWSWFTSILVWAWCVVMLMGCSTSKIGRTLDGDIPDSFPHHSLASILNSLPSFPDELERVRIEAAISVSSPDLDGRFTAIADAARFDSTFIRIKFPLGIEGARVLITPDSAFTYDRIANTVFRGSSDQMKSVLPGSVIGLDLVEQITGFISLDKRVKWDVQFDSTRYYLHAPDGTSRYTVDPSTWRVEHVQFRTLSGQITEQRWYLDFREKSGLILPTRMINVQPEKKTRLSITLKEVDRNPGRLHFDLGIRADTKWKDLMPQ